jgi:hypothetical protein
MVGSFSLSRFSTHAADPLNVNTFLASSFLGDQMGRIFADDMFLS